MVQFMGKLLQDEEGHICMKVQISPQNPELIDVPLEELLEDYLNKEVAIEIFKVKKLKDFKI